MLYHDASSLLWYMVLWSGITRGGGREGVRQAMFFFFFVLVVLAVFLRVGLCSFPYGSPGD